MHLGTILAYAFLATWAVFIVRGFATGRMLARGGDIVREDRPRTFAFAMVANVSMLLTVLAMLVIA